MSDVICDSGGWPITKGHDYKIRLRGGGLELALYAKDWKDKAATHSYHVAAGPAGSGSVFYIESDSWTSGKELQLRAKGSTWGSFESRTDLYIDFVEYGETNIGLSLTPDSAYAEKIYGISGTDGNVFLGSGSSVGLRVVPHWGPEAGWYYVLKDFAGSFLDVQFVRMPKSS